MAGKVSVIVPTYNERGNIKTLLSSLTTALKPFDYEIIVVDDCSPDGTWEIVNRYSKRDGRIKLIKRVGERGLGSAVLKGMGAATGNTFVVMDADMSHNPKDIPTMIYFIESGYGIVIGSRYVAGGSMLNWPFKRRLQSKIACMLARSLLNVKISDPMSGFFAIKRDVYLKMGDNIKPRGYKILLYFYIKGGPAKVKEIPILLKNRTRGRSKLDRGVVIQYLRMLYQLRSI